MRTPIAILLCASLLPASREFSGATDNLSDGTPAAGSEATGAITACGWLYINSAPGTSGRMLFITAAVNSLVQLILLSSNTIQFVRNTSGTSRSAVSSQTLSTSTWYYICGTYDGAGSASQIYISSGSGINTTMAESAYTSQSTGSGTDNAGPATLIVLGNNSLHDRVLPGRLAESVFYGSVLTTAQMNQLARGYPVAGVLNYAPLYGVDSPELDNSGQGNSFIVTGATAAAHAPIAPSFGWWN